jgi:putative oxidoreductase
MDPMSLAVPLIFRICLVILFPFSTLDKIFNWNGALKQANSGILPGGPILLVAAMVVEVGTSILIVAGVFDRAAAALLAFYCVVTALLYHQFWASGDFFASGDSKGRAHFWDFLKNFGLVGGLGLIILGAPLASVDYVARHPMSSTPAYQPTATEYR